MAARGWTVHGLEQSPAAAAYAAQISGCPVTAGTLDDLNRADNHYDVIHLADVIEHLRSPRAALRQIRRALQPDGLLVLTTPDVGSLSAHVLRHKWPNYKPEHLFYPDRLWITQLLANEGFLVRKITSAVKALTLDFALNYFRVYGPRFAWELMSPLMPWLPTPVRRVPVQVSAGDMLLFATPFEPRRVANA